MCIILGMIEIQKRSPIDDCQKYYIKDGNLGMIFGFSETVLTTWGNPEEGKLLEIMKGYINKFGFDVAQKILCSENTPLNLQEYMDSLR